MHPTRLPCALIAGLALALFPCATRASAQSWGFGEDVTIAADQSVEQVRTFGGDALILGEVRGDVLTMGGEARIVGHVGGDVFTFGGSVFVEGGIDGDLLTFGGDAEITGQVGGDVSSKGGDIRIAGEVGGEVQSMGGSVAMEGDAEAPAAMSGGTMRGADLSSLPLASAPGAGAWLGSLVLGAFRRLGFALLVLLLALGMRALAPERLAIVQRAIVREPLSAISHGLAGMLLAWASILGLAITLIGLPIAALLALLALLFGWLGLASSATILGALLPLEALDERPMIRLLAGVGVIWLVSWIPWLGDLLLLLVATAGCGAAMRTRLGRRALPEALGQGPYRSAIA
ncbi:MAG: hypothetical protein OEY14_09535 [Myxococcales bacterium]|nr:hypothetical protein [Myxococcales bacterium]